MRKFLVLSALMLLFGGVARAQQNALLATTLSNAINDSQNTLQVVSATGITVTSSGTTQTLLYINREAMNVVAVNGTQITVSRGAAGTRAGAHNAGAQVISGRPTWFTYTQTNSGTYGTTEPQGACTLGDQPAQIYINILSGQFWQCSTAATPNRWVPYFGNAGTSAVPIRVSATVASAAGVITPSGPLFHVSGTLAITGFTLPFGYRGGSFCLIPDAVFTTTTAGNIANASTAVVGRPLCYQYDASAAKPFFGSY